jgi:hypothetical protein
LGNHVQPTEPAKENIMRQDSKFTAHNTIPTKTVRSVKSISNTGTPTVKPTTDTANVTTTMSVSHVDSYDDNKDLVALMFTSTSTRMPPVSLSHGHVPSSPIQIHGQPVNG